MKPENEVRVVNETRSAVPKINFKKLLATTAKFLKKDRLDPVAFVFVSHQKSQKLNSSYRSHKHATNVLSFGESRDIILTPGVIKKEATDKSLSIKDRTQQLALHGLLHLEGFSHDTPGKAKKMEALEKKILKKLGY